MFNLFKKKTKQVQLYYFNDRPYSCYISIHTLNNVYIVLKPAIGTVVNLELQLDQIPFIKIWENNHVLISGISLA